MPADPPPPDAGKAASAAERAVLQFDIPTIDWLFGQPLAPANGSDQSTLTFPEFLSVHQSQNCGIAVERGKTTSLCILGPDGTGKSLLALHFAAHYAHQCATRRQELKRIQSLQPCVLYASTDLSHSKAHDHWEQFGLNYQPHYSPFPERPKSGRGPINLGLYAPGIQDEDPQGFANSLARYLASASAVTARPTERNEPVQVAFIDLQSATAGDDWGYINRVLALLPPVSPQLLMPHLLVIDAVEGLETMVGELDAYGQHRARRSRIAQLFRTAADKCHLFFVCEEKAAERLPEEFVTDVVIRLRNRVSLDYLRRTIEITKVRGQRHVRGEHPYVIRDGRGSTTVGYPHPDEPPLPSGKPPPPRAGKQSYILAFPSLHSRYRDVMVRSNPPAPGSTPLQPFTAFGIDRLNEILSGGLPRGGVTALIGEEGTYKSRLARNFLSQCFLDLPGVTRKPRTPPETATEMPPPGVGILLSVQDHITPPIARRLASHLGVAELDGVLPSPRKSNFDLFEKELQENGRLIYRRLEMHHLTPPILFHIVEAAVTAAQKALGRLLDADPSKPIRMNPLKKAQHLHENMWRVRLVIDDWSLLNRAYPEVARDPIFLPFLLFFLRRKNVTTLIVDTHPGDPETVKSVERDRELPSQVERRLYAWRFPFLGEERVAIRAVPPLSALHPAPVRELRPAEGQSRDETLEVDPEFELFNFSVHPHHPVPLEVRLHSEEPARDRPDVWSPLRNLFQELFRDHARGRGKVLRVMDSSRYEPFRDFCHLQGGSRLDHTLVLQIDEFWSRTRSPLVNLQSYLMAPVGDGSVPSSEDVFGTFRAAGERHKAFSPDGYKLPDSPDRIPFMWDFGFLLCDARTWEQAAKKSVSCLDGSGQPASITVGDIWAKLRVAGRNPIGAGSVSWREFLGACRAVVEGSSPLLPAFDTDRHAASETLSCLFLEVWFSEIAAKSDARRKKIVEAVSCKSPQPEHSLPDLVTKYQHELFRTWLLLGECFPRDRFPDRDLRFYAPTGRPSGPVAPAVRHWYSTASIACRDDGQESSPPGSLVAVRLPGRFSVRGDWDLAIASGSLSTRLGERALDLLSSCRANIERLRQGQGLPTRKFPTDKAMHGAWTRLWAQQEGGKAKRLAYKTLQQIGVPTQPWKPHEPFHWLWRSSLKHFDRQARFWASWLCSVRESWWGEWQEELANAGGGLTAYDQWGRGPGAVGTALLPETWKQFQERCTYFCEQLGN